MRAQETERGRERKRESVRERKRARESESEREKERARESERERKSAIYRERGVPWAEEWLASRASPPEGPAAERESALSRLCASSVRLSSMARAADAVRSIPVPARHPCEAHNYESRLTT